MFLTSYRTYVDYRDVLLHMLIMIRRKRSWLVDHARRQFCRTIDKEEMTLGVAIF